MSSAVKLVLVAAVLVAVGLGLRSCETWIRNQVTAGENVKDAKAVAKVTRKDAKIVAKATQQAATIEAAAKESTHAIEEQIATEPVFADPDCELDAVSLRIINEARGVRAAPAPGGADPALPGSGASPGRQVVDAGPHAGQ